MTIRSHVTIRCTVRLLLVLLWLAVAVATSLLNSCAPKTMPGIAPAPSAIVTVTATAPMIAAVERQTARLETRVAEVAIKTAEIQRTSNQAVAEATKSGDAALVTLATAFQSQVADLKSMTDVATATAADLQADATAAHEQLAKAATERDAAYAEREVIRVSMIEAREESKVALSRMDEKRIAECDRANAWRKRAMATWGTLTAIGTLIVGLKVLKYV